MPCRQLELRVGCFRLSRGHSLNGHLRGASAGAQQGYELHLTCKQDLGAMWQQLPGVVFQTSLQIFVTLDLSCYPRKSPRL